MSYKSRVISGVAIAAALGCLIGLNHLASAQSVERLNAVKSGDAVLSCSFAKERHPRVIPAERVTDFIDGRWYFKKGSATNCDYKEVEK